QLRDRVLNGDVGRGGRLTAHRRRAGVEHVADLPVKERDGRSNQQGDKPAQQQDEEQATAACYPCKPSIVHNCVFYLSCVRPFDSWLADGEPSCGVAGGHACCRQEGVPASPGSAHTDSITGPVRPSTEPDSAGRCCIIKPTM